MLEVRLLKKMRIRYSASEHQDRNKDGKCHGPVKCILVFSALCKNTEYF
jgi:hypothetical protein